MNLVSPRAGQPWPVGTLVVDASENDDPGPFAVRMVIGYKEDGRCMTVLASPPPWMRAPHEGAIYVDPVEQLRPVGTPRPLEQEERLSEPVRWRLSA